MFTVLDVVQQVWSRHADRFMLQQPVTGSMVVIVVVIAATVTATIIWRSKLSDRKLDLRPVALIFNGFMFGASGVGVPLSLILTVGGIDFFQVIDRESPLLRHVAAKHLSYVYLITCLFDLWRPMLNSHDAIRKTTLDAICCLVQFIAFALYPAGPVTFVGFVHGTFRAIHYGYLVTTTCGGDSVTWRSLVELVNFVFGCAMFVHQAYYLSQVELLYQKVALFLTTCYSFVSSYSSYRKLIAQ